MELDVEMLDAVRSGIAGMGLRFGKDVGTEASGSFEIEVSFLL
jgi:hypothetical protein